MLNKAKNIWFLHVGISAMLITILVDVFFVNNIGNYYFSAKNFYIGVLFFLFWQMYGVSVEVKKAFDSMDHAKDMEIAFLQAQIGSHFFFNTLNTIYCLMDSSVRQAQSLILSFSDFVRIKYSFDYREDTFCTLDDEISMIKDYIAIENMRMGDKIILHEVIDNKHRMVKIPRLLLQPLVENVVKHGLESEKISIHLSSIKFNKTLEVSISDNGRGMDKITLTRIQNSSETNSGTGIKNTKYRLEKCYGSSLNIESNLGIGTKVSFIIPMEAKL